MLDIDRDRYRARPHERFSLRAIDPDAHKAFSGRRDEIEQARDADLARIRELHERLHAEKRQALLIVFLAIDTGGKDSTIERIFSGLNPQGCRVTSFGVPTPAEQARDFLWRVHAEVPPKGLIGIFNRSHYEDVTVPRVHGEIDRATWERRYEHIVEFEQLLAESGTTVLKFHLRISKEEQAERLRDRLTDPTKHWKFDPNDLAERGRWDRYQQAFEDAIAATSAAHAPWYVVPANAKWFRDAVVAHAIADTLEAMDPHYPAPVADIGHYRVES